MTHSLSSLTSIARISTLSIAPLRSTTAHRLRHGRAGKGPDTRVGWPGDFSGALRGRCDLLSRHAQGTQGHYWTEPSPQREIVLELLKSGVLQLEDGATQLLELIRIRLGRDLNPSRKRSAARRVRTLQTFPSLFRSPVLAVDATLHCRAMTPARTISCRQSNPCPPLAKANPRPRKSSRMSYVDFFFWKTRHSQDRSRCLSSVLRVRATRTVTLQTHLEKLGATNVSGAMTLPCRSSFKAATLQAAYTGQEKKTTGRRLTATTRTHWTHRHLNGTTPRDMTTILNPKKRTGMKTSMKLIRSQRQHFSRTTFLHCWASRDTRRR